MRRSDRVGDEGVSEDVPRALELLSIPPDYCQYAAGPCDQDFSSLVQREALFLYPSEPRGFATTIAEAARIGVGRGRRWATWSDIHIEGRIVFCEVCKSMRLVDALVADVTTLNFNVLFEIGFGIGLGIPVIPIRDTSFERDKREFDEIGVLQTFGYLDYQNAEGLAGVLLDRIPEATPLPDGARKDFLESPLYLLPGHLATEGVIQLRSSVKKSRLKFRSYEPSEMPPLSLSEARRQVGGSVAVVANLLSSGRTGASVHNGLAALLCGMAMAEQKVVVMLQEVLDQADKVHPIDYRDVIAPYAAPNQIPHLLERVIPLVVEGMQHREPSPRRARDTILLQLDLGDVAAENEITGLETYFVQTGQYYQARQGHARLVVGRKGSGKTAIFYEIRNSLKGPHSRLVLDLKPDGHQFTRLREFILERMSVGLQEHTLVAFWHFILLAELAHKILRQDWAYAERDPSRADMYERVRDVYAPHDPDFEADFSQRLLREVQAISGRLGGVPMEEIGARLTELMFAGDVRELSDAVADYLSEKDEVWILIDNLDKGWPTHGATTEDVLVIRTLLDAVRKVQQRLDDSDVELRCLVFIRTDIYEHLLRETPDKGKDTAIVLDWDDPTVFEEIIRKRVESSSGLTGDFAEMWRTICDSHIEIQDTFDYLVERTLMRPRDLLLFLRRCIDVAVNRGHSRVLVEDILQAEKGYSEDMLLVLDFEIQDTFPRFADVIYSFQGAPRVLGREEAQGRLLSAGLDSSQFDEAIEVLLRFSFFGVGGREFAEDLYAYATQSNVRRLLSAIERGSATLVIHPAFREALSIQP
jgi:hypothetical protein